MSRVLRALAAVILGPVACLMMVPVRLSQSLWNSRVLASGTTGWNRFTARGAFNSLFYWTMALNLERYGRRGVSRELGVGEFPLSRWIAHNVFSLLTYRHLGTIVPLAGMLMWWSGHLLWVDAVPPLWAATILVLTGISTTFYSNTFVLQNYNAAGWAFFGAGLYALLTGKVSLLALLWLGVSFTSPTVLVYAGAATVAVAVFDRSPALLIALIPAGLKMLTHFWFTFAGEKKGDAIGFIARGIGMTKQGVRYKHERSVTLVEIYRLLLAVQFFVVAWLRSGELPVVAGAAIVLFVVNARVTRFADHQSAQMFLGSAIVAETFLRADPFVLLSFWYAISPAPLFVQWDRNRRYLFDVPVYSPYSLERAFRLTSQFFAPVPDGSRVFMAFEDPGSSHSKVFDRLAPCRELLQYAAVLRKIHLMPDWWAVFHLNYPEAPSLWGRRPEQVIDNLTRWNAQWAIIYQKDGETLPDDWALAGFFVHTELSMSDVAGEAGLDKVPGLGHQFRLLERRLT